MNVERPQAPAFPLTRSLATMLLLIGAGAAVVVGVLGLTGTTEQIPPALAGAAVAAIAGVLALLPMRLAAGSPLEQALMLGLLGTGIRLVATVAGVIVLMLALGMGRAAGLWTLGWYALLLGVEVRALTRYFGSLSGGGGAGRRQTTNDASPRRDDFNDDQTSIKLVEARPC
ncbi:MAG: hypothetical protein WD118_07905 [Phycisphaeraceae bacterium]